MVELNAALEGEQHQRVQNAGKQMLVQVYSLVKTGEIHDLNNDAYDRPTEKLLEAVESLTRLERQAVTMLVYEGVVQINSHALWLDPPTQELVQELEQWLARREAGGVTFAAKPSEGEIRRFFYHFARFRPPAETRNPFAALCEHLRTDGITRMRLAPQPVRLDDVGQGVRGVASLWFYAKAVAAMRTLLARAPLDVKQARRIALDLVDACASEQDLFVAMPVLGTAPHDAPRRAVDTALLVGATARGLGLTLPQCADLALSALLAEMGAAWPNPEPAEFTDAEATATHAVRHLLDCAEISDLVLRRFIVALEHGVGPSLSGPPYLPGAPTPTLETQLIVVARTWLAAARADAEDESRSPLNATLTLLTSPPRGVDRGLCLVFAAVVGPLPVGTLVELQNGDVAVVSEVEHLRGRGVYGAEQPPVAAPRRVFVVRVRTASGASIPERAARVRLGDDATDGAPWAIARTLSSVGWTDLVARALLQRPSTVVMQLGMRA